MSVCRQTFWKPLLVQFFSDSKVDTHDLCANMQKTIEQILEILILKLLVNF